VFQNRLAARGALAHNMQEVCALPSACCRPSDAKRVFILDAIFVTVLPAAS
jgi:hypothetical protein